MRQIAIALLQHQGKYLVGRRPAGVALAGLYEFPGGKVEAGETACQAAERECLEETGLVVRATELLLTQQQTYDHGTLSLEFWECVPAGETVDLTPQEPFFWVSRGELFQLEFPAGNRGILAFLQESFGPNAD